MSRSLRALLLAIVSAACGSALAADLRPQDFAYGMPIEGPNAGTAYRFTVPVEVFTKVAHEDLRDIRVFNAAGEVVPYELRQAPPKSTARPQGAALPLFPLHADARASLNGVRVTIHSEGAAVDLQTGAAPPDPHVITSYVLDAREIAAPLSGLQLHWPEGAAEFSGAVRIESSDDLGSWHVVKANAPVIHLLTGGAELIQSALEFPSTRARFWRLTWVGKTAPFELTAVTAQLAVDEPVAPQSAVTVSGSPVKEREGELSFDLGAKLPVMQVDLILPQANSVLKVELLSRPRATDVWRPVGQSEFYRVSSDSSEHHNDPIRIPADYDRFWLARRIPPTAPIGVVQLWVAWDAMDVVFLAQGAGPFTLAYGSGSAGPASVTLDPLVKGVTVAQAETGPSYVLGGAERLRPPPRTLPWRMTVLWAALGLGVVLLAWMAYRLSKELGARPGS
jgi:Protein of unknown function (DUF3999)